MVVLSLITIKYQYETLIVYSGNLISHILNYSREMDYYPNFLFRQVLSAP